MEAVRFSEKSGPLQTTQNFNPEDRTIQNFGNDIPGSVVQVSGTATSEEDGWRLRGGGWGSNLPSPFAEFLNKNQN
jgi:hypothetical protein